MGSIGTRFHWGESVSTHRARELFGSGLSAPSTGSERGLAGLRIVAGTALIATTFAIPDLSAAPVKLMALDLGGAPRGDSIISVPVVREQVGIAVTTSPDAGAIAGATTVLAKSPVSGSEPLPSTRFARAEKLSLAFLAAGSQPLAVGEREFMVSTLDIGEIAPLPLEPEPAPQQFASDIDATRKSALETLSGQSVEEKTALDSLAEPDSAPFAAIPVPVKTASPMSERIADALDIAPKTRLDARVNGVKTGSVDFQQQGTTIAVKLRSVLDLLHDRYDQAEYEHFRSAPAIDSFVPLAALQSAGIPIRYDPVYDEIELAVDYDDAPQAAKVQVEQIGAPTLGGERALIDQISR